MTLKRITAALTAFILIISIAADTPANYQYPVNDLSITDYSSKTSASYTLNLKWLRPLASTKMEGGANVTQSDTERAAGYEVYFRNATKSQAFAAPINDSLLKTNNSGASIKTDTDESIGAQCTLNLDGGSIYAFRVQPYHNHTVKNADNTYTIRRATMDASLSESVALYLTDISLTASASGHNMTVTWDNPTMDGKEIFTSYRFYYTAGGASVASIPMTPYAEVAAGSPDLIRTRDGKLQYTFYDGTLQVGKLYAVKVEPLFNGKPARTQQTISIANKTYSLSYRGMNEREYRANDAYVNPSLNVRAEGQDYARVYWDSLQSSIQDIESIWIYSSGAQDMSNMQLIGVLTGDSAYDTNIWLTDRPAIVTYYQICINYPDIYNRPIWVWSEIACFDPAYNDFSPYKPIVITPVTDNAMWRRFI